MTPLFSSKPDLRRTLRTQREAVPLSEREEAAHLMAKHLTPHLHGTVAGYWPIGAELSPVPALLLHVQAGGTVLLPRVSGTAMTFHPWREGDALLDGPFGTREPAASDPVIPDVLLAPLLAFDAQGYRLGYGGGFYDRYLAAHPHVRAIGIAYPFQEVAALPAEPHDVRLAGVATPDGVRLFA